MSESKNKPASASKSAKSKKADKAKRHRFFLVAVILIFIWWFNNYTLKTTNAELASAKLSSPIRIAVISDQHATKYGISNSAILSRIEKADPDIVAVLGDMYSRNSEWELVMKPINLIQSITEEGYPVYFVTGDHDYVSTDYKDSAIGERYIDEMEKAGAHVMNYKCEYTEINGNKVQIMGIDNVYFSPTFDLKNAFDRDAECYSILLAHLPNYEAFSDFGADLTLCADTHGDMVQLPFNLGPIYEADTKSWFPQITMTGETIYDKGVFGYSGGNMFITSGIGAAPLPIRFNNRPEVAVIDIQPKK